MRKTLAVALTLLAAASAPAAERPNVVVLLADDMGFSDIGSFGGEIRTPHIDGLAAGGARFTEFSVHPRCSPTRAALLTGLYPHEAGVGYLPYDWGRPGYRGELADDARTLPELLRGAGYRSYMTGKWHLAQSRDPARNGGWPLQRGFDRFFGTLGGGGNYFDPVSLMRDNAPAPPEPDFIYYTDAISDEASGYVREHVRTQPLQPFFLYVAYTAPHSPLHALEEDIARYRGRYEAGWDALRAERFERMGELGVAADGWSLSPRDPDVLAWEEISDRAWQARRMEVYAAQVDRMDQGIGRLLATLRQTGQLERTLIFFLSDNGGSAQAVRGWFRMMRFVGMPAPENTGDGRPIAYGNEPERMPGPEDTYQSYGRGWSNLSNAPFRQHKGRVYEGGVASPLIVHWPAGLGVAPGTVIRSPGHVVDLMPTVLELAGAAYPAEQARPLRGQSLLPLLQGAPQARAAIFFEHQGHRAVREGNWKLVSQAGEDWELYDLAGDRSELRDLAAEYPERVEKLAEAYDTYAAGGRVESWPWVIAPLRTAAAIAVTVPLGLVALAVAWRRRRRTRRA